MLYGSLYARGRDYHKVLRNRLQQLMDAHCHRVRRQDLPARTPLRTLWSLLVFHTVRHLPAWAGLWPAHTPHVTLLRPRRGTAVQKR